jgi:UDP-N-acetylmuramate dehydrogenase
MTIQDSRELEFCVETLSRHGCPIFVVGGGSNLLVSDSGFRGAVVKLDGAFDFLERQGLRIRAGCATSLAKLVKQAQAWGLDGLSFAVGIPGTVGGAIAVNAGAFDCSVGERLTSAVVHHRGRGYARVDREEFGFGYRRTSFEEPAIILEALFELEEADPLEIKRGMDDLLSQRIRSQPYRAQTAGCVFKNPEGAFAGELIERTGCKGMRVGRAEVSKIHANFIVNLGGASARDVLLLVERVRRRVEEREGVLLEREIVLLGEFEED